MMKKTLLILFSCIYLSASLNAQSCTPNTTACTNGAAVLSMGGLCDTLIPDGTVGVLYDESLQFYIEGVCFQTGDLGVTPDVEARITDLTNIAFSGLPNGIIGGTNQPSYVIPQNQVVTGCGYFYGTPTEAGVFSAQIVITADAILCAFAFPITDQMVPYDIEYTVLPNASFSGLGANYCESDPSVTLTPTGTTGGTFSGPGVSGTSFDPAVAGLGSHTITYTVTAQEGTASGPATNSSTQTVNVTLPNVYYADTDNDTFGDPMDSTFSCSTTAPTGFVVNNLDCDDTNMDINPNATDIPNNSIDEDCSGSDETTVQDLDGDTFDNTVDCNDNDSLVYPGAPEICDGIDNNCANGIDEGLTIFTYYADTDNDTYGDPMDSVNTCASTAPMGYVTDNTDCEPLITGINPGAIEICDGIDNNCDGNVDEDGPSIYYVDADNDGFGNAMDPTINSCETTAPAGYSSLNTDCDDTDNTIFPGATEIPGDGIDQDCDSTTTAIRDLNQDLLVNIYPNPTKGLLTIEVENTQNIQVQLFDMNGRQMSLIPSVSNNAFVIDMSTLVNGIYLVKITSENGSFAVQKVVKAN